MEKDNNVIQTPAVVASAPAATNAPATVSNLLLFREAYEQVLPAAAALREEELLPVNIDVPSAVATTAGVLPKIMAYRAAAAKLEGFDISHFDQLQLRAFAVGHAHTRFQTASAPPEALAALNERGIKLRDTMYLDAVALANRGMISGERIGSFKANVGYKNIAFDLLGLAEVLRESWDKIASRTGIQPSELSEAELLGRQLVDAVGMREQAPAVVAQVQAQRQRNFTLFSQSYDQVRRAITFLRWDHDDIDQICPSLYAGRGGRRKEAPAPVPPTPAPLNTDTHTPAAGSTAPATPAETPTPATDKAAAPAGVGLPGANPFAELKN